MTVTVLKNRKRKGVDAGDILAVVQGPATVSSANASNASNAANEPSGNIQILIEEPATAPGPKPTPTSTVVTDVQPTVPDTPDDLKKRGRKPRGGKLTSKHTEQIAKPPPIPNVILHLKCSFKDLQDYTSTQSRLVTDPLKYNAEVPPAIMTYNTGASTFSMYEEKPNASEQSTTNYAYADMDAVRKTAPTDTKTSYVCKDCGTTMEPAVEQDETSGIQIRDVNQKLKKLKVSLYKNSIPEKKSACFWCTYEFDNQACYIPKCEMDGTIVGYGSFCRPECAVAYLMKEGVDDSTKFERYHLLNQLYGKIYNFKNNIKPAPDPHFLLDKFYGNLSIQEYRKLLNTEHILLVIDKPLSRILPELHEDTDDFVMGIYGGNKGAATQAGGVYKVKRQSEKQQGPSKTSIIMGKFGLTQ